jgi:hypothetical protein
MKFPAKFVAVRSLTGDKRIPQTLLKSSSYTTNKSEKVFKSSDKQSGLHEG